MNESDSTFEREKWQAALVRQDKELSIKEREVDLRIREARRSRWSNPLVLAVVGATLAALGNAGVTYFAGVSQRALEEATAVSQRALEEKTASDARILEMIKTGGDPDKAADNLRFLQETKLVPPETQANIAAYLSSRKKGEGAALPASASTRGGVCFARPDGTACGPNFNGRQAMACLDGECIFRP